MSQSWKEPSRPQFEYDKFKWEKFTTRKGKSYEVGVLQLTDDERAVREEAAKKREAEIAEAKTTGPSREGTNDTPTGADLSIRTWTWDVNWPLGDSEWKRATDKRGWDIGHSSHIIDYDLTNSTWPMSLTGDYSLWIRTNTAACRYEFTDADGDVYSLFVVFAYIDHVVRFDSDDPTIVKVLYYV